MLKPSPRKGRDEHPVEDFTIKLQILFQNKDPEGGLGVFDLAACLFDGGVDLEYLAQAHEIEDTTYALVHFSKCDFTRSKSGSPDNIQPRWRARMNRCSSLHEN
jgi:hypothetical protein